jgi:hypothetical protein
MAVLSPPVNVGLTLKIGPDGSLSPTGELGTPGSAGLGMNTVCLTNFDQSVPMGVAIQYLLANCGFPLPYSRYAVDWPTLKTAANAGKAYTANTF